MANDKYHFELSVLLCTLCRHCKLHINHYQAVAWPANTNFRKRAKWLGTCSKQLYSADRQDSLNKMGKKKKHRKKIPKTQRELFIYTFVLQWLHRAGTYLSLFVCIDIWTVCFEESFLAWLHCANEDSHTIYHLTKNILLKKTKLQGKID